MRSTRKVRKTSRMKVRKEENEEKNNEARKQGIQIGR